MALEIFKLVGSIMVDSDAADKSLQKTDDKAKGIGERLGDGVKKAGKWAAGIGAAALAAGGAMVAAAKDEAANLDVIDKASKRMDISAESYQQLSYAAGLCGVEMSTMEKAAKKLEGTDLSLDDALDQIMSLSDETERTQAAIDLFGESVAYSMGPMLQEGGESFDAMKQEAKDLGLVLSNDVVAGGAEMNDSFKKVEGAVSALKSGLMAEFMPVIQKLLDWVIQHMPEIQAFVSNVISTISGLIKEFMPVIKAVFETAGILWNTTLKPILTGIIDFVTGVFTGNWSKAWEGVKKIFSGFANGLKEIFRAPINWIIDKINSFLGGLNGIKIPDWVPGVGGRSFNINLIPKLARGGVLERGQVGLLEGSGAEAVVPLENNAAWVRAVAKDINEATGGSSKRSEELLELLLSVITTLADRLQPTDTDKLVAIMAPGINTELGRTAKRKWV